MITVIDNEEQDPTTSVIVQVKDKGNRPCTRGSGNGKQIQNSDKSKQDSSLQVNHSSNNAVSDWTSLACGNRFSKSMGDLTSLRKQQHHRSSVILEDGFLAEHAEVVVRARNRFRELERKYPDIFKNFSRSCSISSLPCNEEKSTSCGHASHFLKSAVDGRRRNQRRNTVDDKIKERTQSVPVYGVPSSRSGFDHFQYSRRAPPLSLAMRSQNLNDSCDSAFGDHDAASTVCHETSPPARSPTNTKCRRFLFPGDSVESDKDSGISADRPFIPSAKTRRNSRPVRWADSESFESAASNSDLSKSGCLNQHQNESPSNNLQTKNSSYRRGILKSVAYRNQELNYGSLDSEDDKSACYYRRQAFMRTKGPRHHMRSHPQYFSSGDTESDGETVSSICSEIIVRPKSAREQYLSLYKLSTSGSHDFDQTVTNRRIYKSCSMPELATRSSVKDDFASFSNEISLEKKKYRKNKFNRRSGLYVVNDYPIVEKPRLNSNSSKKALKFSRKKLKQKPLHITEQTKTWYDNCTAVSKPTDGQSMGKIIGVSHDFGGMAYQVELNRPGSGLYGFFIQKGYKQYKQGIFVSRIMDSTSAKFLAGLLSPGDEILEINGLCTELRPISEIHDIMAHSDKLALTILPILDRKDW